MYDTNEHMHACVPGSKLVQHNVFLAEFRLGEDCCGLSDRKFSVNVELPGDFSFQRTRQMTLIRIAESNLGIAEFHSSNDNRMFNTQVLYTIVSRVI